MKEKRPRSPAALLSSQKAFGLAPYIWTKARSGSGQRSPAGAPAAGGREPPRGVPRLAREPPSRQDIPALTVSPTTPIRARASSRRCSSSTARRSSSTLTWIASRRASIDALRRASCPATARDRGARGRRRPRARETAPRPSLRPGEAARLTTRIATAEVEPAAVFPGPERGSRCAASSSSGGLGEHKWADRRLARTRGVRRMPPGELPLLVDATAPRSRPRAPASFAIGTAGWRHRRPTGASCPASLAGGRSRPPAAGGSKSREKALTLRGLSGREVFLAGSVRGIEPVLAARRRRPAPPGELSARIAADLRRRWLPAPQAESAAVLAGGRRAGRPAR